MTGDIKMTRQTERENISEARRRQRREKLAVLTEQRDDLIAEIDQLFEEVMAGKKTAERVGRVSPVKDFQ